MISFVGFELYGAALWYVEYYYDDGEISTGKRPNYRMRKMNLEFPVHVHELVGLDNGLICLAVQTKCNGILESYNLRHIPNEPLYICNPIAREFVELPRILIDEMKRINGVHIVYGFGYHPITNKYKVVRICYVGNPKSPSFKGLVEVYTLGSGNGWRRIRETRYYLWPRSLYSGNPAGLCVNGALHWHLNESQDIVAFDLADEEFHLLRTPTRYFDRRRLFVMRGCLCLENWNSVELELWVLKKDKEDKSSTSHHMNGKYCMSWSWRRELTVSINS
ncbi:hypothetical protein MKX03_023574 [Papaver bracteatum]|nr:hypothetical protein MKX03_023574 [Papaver bracteatum]